jgi:hypothetical protein
MTTKYLLPVLFVSVSVLGCSKKKENDAPTEPTPVSDTTTTPKVVAEPPAVPTEPEPAKEADVALPTAADFEGEAIEQISDATLEQELAAIEKELGN